MKTLLSILILLQLTFLHADNYSLSFDGDDDYVIIPASSLNGLSAFSFSAWFYSDGDQTGWSNIIQQDDTGAGNDLFYIRYQSRMSSFRFQLDASNGNNGNGNNVHFSIFHFSQTFSIRQKLKMGNGKLISAKRRTTDSDEIPAIYGKP